MKYNSEISRLRRVLDKARDEGKISDIGVLHTLAVCCNRPAGKYREAAQRRMAFHQEIREKAEDGVIAMVWSGMDCDCVRYSGDVRLVPANWREIDAAANDKYEWADGPCDFYLERPSVAKQLEYASKDLVLEAFEDGHPHVIYT